MIIMKGSESSKEDTTGLIAITMTAIGTPLTIAIPMNITTVARRQRESGYSSELLLAVLSSSLRSFGSSGNVELVGFRHSSRQSNS